LGPSPEAGPVYLTASRAIARLAGLPALLGGPVGRHRPGRAVAAGTRVLAWGRKPSAARAETLAAALGLPVLRLEDGFARSVGLGAEEPPLSVVLDDVGIYYDATAPSRLELLTALPLDQTRIDRARTLIDLWRQGRVSKYNQAREYDGPLPEAYVLVADQTAGDASIAWGLAGPESFSRMLGAALDEHPGRTVLLKVHPEVAAGRKRGHFDLDRLRRDGRVRVLGEAVHPVRLLERAAAVYTVTSQLGFEALLWERPVRTFGMPFYAGWGLTADDLPAPARRRPVSLPALVHAALVDYARYRDPETGGPCSAERVVSWLGLQRRMRERFPARVYALGFSAWKRPLVRDFLQGSQIRFVTRPSQVPDGAALAVWGRRDPAPVRPGLLIRLEDGFLRSVGLGVDLVRPLSWVADTQGMYYDAGVPSALEALLAGLTFSPELLDRARALRRRLVAEGVTKYNVDVGRWRRPAGAARVVLVPGQVEADASIRFGGGSVRTNMGLLRAVRLLEPDAYIVYKPHPDVVIGMRSAGVGENAADSLCDAVVLHASMRDLLEQVDAIHVLTSLAGFEALLRKKMVFCHGRPFYAGWGLTRDLDPPLRRGRQLDLDELVAGALLVYPTYCHPVTGRFTTAEAALDLLLAQRERGAVLPWWRRALRPCLAFLKQRKDRAAGEEQ